MNLHDSEWVPEPSDPTLLRKVQVSVKAAASPQDVANLRTLLVKELNGAIPHEARGHVWMSLLSLRAEDLTAESPTDFARVAREAVSEQNSKDQIWKDVERTRPGLKRFQQPAVRGALLRLLSLFCSRLRVQYIQGLNELLAPFVLLADTGGNPRFVYALFGAFVARFAPWMLDTSEAEVFGVLKRAFKYFGRLLLYHDPVLFWLLERNGMTPDLYATSWFVTLFARNFSVEAVLALWDLLLLEDNPLGPYFFALALLLSKRDVLVATDPSLLPETLMGLTAHSALEVRTLWTLGEKLRSDATPPSYQRLMNDRLMRPAGRPSPTAISAARSMQASACLQTTPDDLFAAAGGVQYFTWDCRTKGEFGAGHLAASVLLPLDALRGCRGDVGPAVLTDAARRELTAAVALCEPLRGKSHICLVGSGDKEEDDTDINPLALYLTEVGIPFVSTLRGGFAAAVSAAEVDGSISGVELVDYEQEAHQRSRLERQRGRSAQPDLSAKSPASTALSRRRSSQGSSGGGDGGAPSGSTGGSSGTALLGLSGTTAIPPPAVLGAVPEPDAGQASTETRPFGGSGGDGADQGNFGISSFFDKSDAEVSRALNRALNGVVVRPPILSAVAASPTPGLPVFSPVSTAAADHVTSGFAPDDETSRRPKETMPSFAAGSLDLNGRPPSPPSSPLSAGQRLLSPDAEGRPPVGGTSRAKPDGTMGSAQRPLLTRDRVRSTRSVDFLGGVTSASVDAGLGLGQGGSGSSLGNLISPDVLNRHPASTAGTPMQREPAPSRSSSARSTVATIRRGLFGSMGGGSSSSPSGGAADSISPTKGGVDSPGRAKWRREAWAGWLDDRTLPLGSIPKDFVVDSSDAAITTGLRLFSCRARSETSAAAARGRGRASGSSSGLNDMTSSSGEFKRRFLGVSTRYFMLLSPQGLRSHLLKVKLIRHLHDIVRITFKRSRPELVTFELLSAADPSAPNEQVVCIMPDGLSDCVELIKNALADSDSVQPLSTSVASTSIGGEACTTGVGANREVEPKEVAHAELASAAPAPNSERDDRGAGRWSPHPVCRAI
eukprot:TRINITY_DN2813_c0_g1_i1.p1 TRINITY_DN2813_c0_g1~~TRINITY_DN2813_c0_g1_i1.p1  ORF type:complete len:1064 (-),score=268.75 TRINITY_DN2813_c0_g1_i1:418-3609(-)